MDTVTSEVQRHGIMYMISSAGITLIGFIATMFYAHWIGAAILGSYFLFLSYFSVLSIFTDMGIGLAAQNKMCDGKEREHLFTANLTVRLVLYLAIVCLLFVFKYKFVDLDTAGLFWLLIALLGISTLSSSISVAIGASNRLGLLAFGSLANNLIRIGIQIILVFLGFQIYGLIGGLIAGLLSELILYSRYIDYHLRKFRFTHVKTLIGYSGWAFLTTTGTTVFENVSIIILSIYLPVADVGIYGVCWTFSFFALFMSNALINTLFIKVSRWYSEGDINAIIQSLSRASTYALVISLPMVIGAMILGQHLLYYFYGATFAAGGSALVIIIGMRVFQSIHQLFSYYLMATDHVRLAFFGVFFGMIANIILALVLVPVFGLIGAAIASLCYIIISVLFEYRYLSRIVPIVFEKSRIARIVSAAIAMGILLMIVDEFLNMSGVAKPIVMIIIGSLMYFTLLFLMDSHLREDAMRIVKINWLAR